VEFTPAAPGAPVGIYEGRGPLIVKPNALARAKRCTDAAGFAPVAEDVYLETLFFAGLRSCRRGRLCFFGFVRARALQQPGRSVRLLIGFHMSSKWGIFTAIVFINENHGFDQSTQYTGIYVREFQAAVFQYLTSTVEISMFDSVIKGLLHCNPR
jgi:hypothetical protein